MVVAVIVAGPGGPPEVGELIDLARERLAPHEVPKVVEFVDELPRTASGKLLRRMLNQPGPGDL